MSTYKTFQLKFAPLNSNEETLLPFLWLHPGPFQNWIRAADSNSLNSGRAHEAENILFAVLLARSLERVPNGEEDGRSEEKRRLADATRALDGA